MSSANLQKTYFSPTFKSFMKTLKRICLHIEPWGTPLVMGHQPDITQFIITLWALFSVYIAAQFTRTDLNCFGFHLDFFLLPSRRKSSCAVYIYKKKKSRAKYLISGYTGDESEPTFCFLYLNTLSQTYGKSGFMYESKCYMGFFFV